MPYLILFKKFIIFIIFIQKFINPLVFEIEIEIFENSYFFIFFVNFFKYFKMKYDENERIEIFEEK